MSENSNELIIDPELVAEIQRQYREREAELEAAQKMLSTPIASEAERFAAAGCPTFVRARGSSLARALGIGRGTCLAGGANGAGRLVRRLMERRGSGNTGQKFLKS